MHLLPRFGHTSPVAGRSTFLC